MLSLELIEIVGSPSEAEALYFQEVQCHKSTT
jgi:hypothetical protein